jgi:hypothetical protein
MGVAQQYETTDGAASRSSPHRDTPAAAPMPFRTPNAKRAGRHVSSLHNAAVSFATHRATRVAPRNHWRVTRRTQDSCPAASQFNGSRREGLFSQDSPVGDPTPSSVSCRPASDGVTVTRGYSHDDTRTYTVGDRRQRGRSLMCKYVAGADRHHASRHHTRRALDAAHPDPQGIAR